MALGFCPPVLAHLRSISECNTPSSKITPAGFLRLLVENNPQTRIINADHALKLDDGSGHIRDLIVKYLKRAVPEQTSTSDDCEINNMNIYNELTIPTTNYRKKTFLIADEDLARYCADATAMVAGNGAPTGFMREMLDQIMVEANALIGAIDMDLLTLQATRFGVNVHTGSNAAETINFPNVNAGVNNSFEDGMIHILQDAALNEICGELLIAGHGNFNAFTLQQMVACCNQLGIDSSRFTGFRFYPDLYSQDIWGTNHIGVFSQGSVGFVELNRYEGFRSGRKGTSEFFTMPLPIDCPQCNGGYDSIDFDVQLRYIDCPTTVTICGEETTVRSGWALTLGKSFGLFNIPTDAYQNTAYGDCYTDRLSGNNGTLRFIATNT